ncbi:hypothetical protein PoB_003685400, partial [Plakobranchus ocellatus]
VDGPVPSACVVTRAQARKTIDNNSQSNMVPSYDPSIPTPLNCVPLADVGSRQKVNPTLKDWFNRVGAPPVGGVYFTITEGKLLRHYQRAGSDIINTTMAVPESLRHIVLSVHMTTAYRAIRVSRKPFQTPRPISHGLVSQMMFDVILDLVMFVRSNSDLSPETSLQYQFVIDFHNKLKAGWQLAASALKESADKSREHQSLNPGVKTFAVDEQVLVLLPSSNNKLSLTLQ